MGVGCGSRGHAEQSLLASESSQWDGPRSSSGAWPSSVAHSSGVSVPGCGCSVWWDFPLPWQTSRWIAADMGSLVPGTVSS